MSRSRMHILMLISLSCVAQAVAQDKKVTSRDGSEMVLVPAGEFIMGSGEGKDDESPPHRVNLPAFYIDKNEITNEQYFRFITATGGKAPLNWGGPQPRAKTERWPVTDVTWFDAMRYAAWAGKRLPTEAEWEKAARGTDGRRFPWGNLDATDARNLSGSESVHPVGEMPKGASPYGCLDMSGNAWEWTADWYQPYPGTGARSVHFGQDYKVIRGGGGIYFYGIDNTGRCSQRGRLVTFGSYDALGFRCVQDLPGTKAAYDGKQVLAEADQLLKASLKPPVTLAFEKEFADMLKAGQFKLNVAGSAGQKGMARTGVPFPQDGLKDPGSIRILGSDRPIPVQAQVLSTWPNKSPRWVLVDFPAQAGGTYTLNFNGSSASAPATPALRMNQAGQTISIDTGVMSAVVTPESLLKEVKLAGGGMVVPSMNVRMRVGMQGAPVQLRPLPAEKIVIEEPGPLRGVIRLTGGFAGVNGEKSPFRYDLRIHATAGSSRLNLLLTLSHFAERQKSKNEYEKPLPTLPVAEASVTFQLTQPATQVTFGGDRTAQSFPAGQRIELLQPDDLKYTIVRGTENLGGGTRAPGWLAAQTPGGLVTLGVRHFWQNHAQSLIAAPKALTLNMWAGKEPFDWESGLAKTHELVLDFARDAAAPKDVVLDPLRVTMPPSWACGSGGAGTLLPRGPEAIERFPYWELLRSASKRNWVHSMPFGMRDFGDAYMGGPYKGKNAYTNLEYDVPQNFLMDFLKTGELWYLTAAEQQVRHQVDVDVDHFNGRVWKHSPQHTTTEAEFGHVFIRGMLLHYLITGERRSLDVARAVGDWMAPRVERLDGIGNERQIGWSLYALSSLYDVTKDPKYLTAAHTACTKLAGGQAATGKFKIRWDNRISFMNGIAMMGMLTVYELTGDEQIGKAIIAVANRTMGFYPEYACRTLNAYCWAAERASDSRYLAEMERTWMTSMENLMSRDAGVTEEVYAWRFTWFACKHLLFPLFEQKPEALPDPATFRGLRLDQQRVELYMKPVSGKRSAVMIMVEGQSRGSGELFDATGKTLRRFDFNQPGRLFQPAAFTLPDDGAVYRLRLTAEQANAWQIHYDGNTKITVYDPGLFLLPVIYPRATGFLKEGSKEVKVKLEAMGEGFHSATLYDPAGHAVAAVRKFVDFQDPGRYEVELKVPVTGDVRGWALEVYNAKVLAVEGLEPYWAGDNDQLFNPERPGQ